MNLLKPAHENPPFVYTVAAWIVLTSLAVAWIVFAVPHVWEWAR